MKVEITSLDHINSYKLVTGIIAPRPIAWVSTIDDQGIFNLAPFSAFCSISMKPAMLGFTAGTDREGRKKDTLRNIEATREFVVNIVDESLAEPMNITATHVPPDVDEFKEAGMTPIPADLVKAPLVAESPINLECRLNQILEFGQPPRINSFIIGEIIMVHIKDELYADGMVQTRNLKAIARLGGDFYCRTRDLFEMKRPD